MRTISILGALSVLAFVGLGCDSPACPAPTTLTNGDKAVSCSNEALQCPYTFKYTACDGTKTTAPSSCTCTNGTWVCPSGPECDSGPPPDDSGDGGDDAADSTPADDADAPTDAADTTPAADAADAPADTAVAADVADAG
jgi:hypothetical protein